MPRKTIVQSLQEAHRADFKVIHEGIGTLIEGQQKMQKDIDEMRPMKNEWPVVKTAVTNTNIRLKKVEKRLEDVEKKVNTIDNNLNDLDKKVAAVLPDHEKRITRLEAKPA